MIDDLLALARPEITRLIPYSSARREHAAQGIYLNANENPYPKAIPHLHRYPQPQPTRLRECFAQLYDLNTDMILMTRGSDEGIDLWLRTFCRAGEDAIMVCPPTYDMYALSAAIQHASVLSVPLIADTFALDIDNMLATWQPSCKLIFLCSPNNPTGNVFAWQEIEKLCTALRNKAIIIVDEAYIEFSNHKSCSTLLGQYDNLAVLRTLSKAYGMAGARCGVVLAHAKLIALLEKVISPYPLASPVIEIVLQELTSDNLPKVYSQIVALKSARDELSAYLARLPFVEKVWPSQANFILLKVKDAKALVAHCASQNIVIRDRSHMYGLNQCVRISLGLPEENQQLQQVLESYQA
ncbi:MAG TPA: histidinol-phosphate transaminase [Gammaproteobacteria bacterium]|nr:histidinol-phosphate transaminase [Gammaproteobacteria bacterium]